jgi:DUF4097 and DUF4098 domain-containing protein YvlB
VYFKLFAIDGVSGRMRRHASLALLFLLASTPLVARVDDTIRKGFNVGDGGTLTLKASVGDVKIVSGGTGVAVEIVRSARNREKLEELEIDLRQSGNDVIIESDWDNDHSLFNWNNNYDVQWNIRVPVRYNVNVRTSGGSIEITDLSGTAELRTSGGNIEGGRLGGPVTAKTSGGSIEITSARGKVVAHTSGGSIRMGDVSGGVEAKTSGGSIALARVGGDVYARTSGGGIRIEEASGAVDASTSGGSIVASFAKQPGADSKLHTSGGGMTVSLARGVAVDLDARATGGGVSSDVPITVQGKQDDDSLAGRINGGGPKLTLRTSGGGIRVKQM